MVPVLSSPLLSTCVSHHVLVEFGLNIMLAQIRLGGPILPVSPIFRCLNDQKHQHMRSTTSLYLFLGPTNNSMWGQLSSYQMWKPRSLYIHLSLPPCRTFGRQIYFQNLSRLQIQINWSADLFNISSLLKLIY